MRQNSVNRKKKPNLATKQCNMQQNTINCTHNKGDFRFLYICHVKKFEIKPNVEKMYRNVKFLHMTDFSPRAWQVGP